MSTIEQTQADQLREQVRDRYANAARQATAGAQANDCGCGQPAGCGCATSCCGPGETVDAPAWGPGLYTPGEQGELPETALLASLGCGNPTAVADLHEGETVLDLGSGGGIDVLLSARRVGSTGKAYGLDMTEEMLALARRNAAEAGTTNVEFLKGHIEQIPSYVGCIAGALSTTEYQQGLVAAGFEQIEVTFTHEVADGLHNAIIKATKPATTAATAAAVGRGTLPMADRPGCC